MPLPVALATTYLIVNFAFVVWIAREEVGGRKPSPGVKAVSTTGRYGPPLLGLIYLVTLAGDWPFFLFVVAFFGLAFWMLDGFLSSVSRPPKR